MCTFYAWLYSTYKPVASAAGYCWGVTDQIGAIRNVFGECLKKKKKSLGSPFRLARCRWCLKWCCETTNGFQSTHTVLRPFLCKILLQCLFIYIMSVFTADNVNIDHSFFTEDKDCILETVACRNFSCLLQVWKTLLLSIVANKAVTFFLVFLSFSLFCLLSFLPSFPPFSSSCLTDSQTNSRIVRYQPWYI